MKIWWIQFFGLMFTQLSPGVFKVDLALKYLFGIVWQQNTLENANFFEVSTKKICRNGVDFGELAASKGLAVSQRDVDRCRSRLQNDVCLLACMA